ncbi:MAG TPA: nucleotidyl transferase AbiEii/AbiGii toxin family protein [Verrucomicrobiota bacterium]|jgi:predicted nucleotidyltransferase component of viral defense system|nr:nucleotidyl transferase AbiEii/AbiGii toxin family protein [Verrucomicrobiota bacterium]HNZ76721.1 nucleotidyl transferase AbiEii/AbiGii toxin family protein [Verrucomicrobiota bacterium]HOX63736.1 nucleotidyl transferase AbiEii/AbiGii toxin family protein [Verrucomicrobiota bacterium]HPI66077.1 nucleotidyl transferase AbiEii/AbiGii toxin family protein [Verrucomicrobiota bacterium]HPV93846.1 nucleotidyl transferase AbiEii/AbiGii toxin family protein [Verrucomicrobiota bacterium]
MTPITRQDILAHQAVVPWAAQYQVEQDLLLCRAMVALFDDKFLSFQIAMRGGTLLHKVHLAPAARYSEDIDLVVVGSRPADHIRRAIRRVLSDVLGTPKASVWDTLALAIRNTVKPSRVLRMTYSARSIIEPNRMLEIVVEANVTERKPHRAVVEMPFSFLFRDKAVQTRIKGFDIHEMLGTKMRAMFQRKRGRDLFDLYWALTKSPTPVEPAAIIESFQHYMKQEGTAAGRAEFVAILDAHLKDRGFCSDTEPLLRSGITYDPQLAGRYVKAKLLSLLPD